MKGTLKKAHESGQDVYLALLALNTAPSHDGKSPAFKLFNRNPRTTLPSIIPNKSRPILTGHKVKKYHDRRANDLSELAPGTSVRMRIDTDSSWKETGKIIEKCQQPRSYLVLNSRGNVVRRNRRHLLPTSEAFQNFDHLHSAPNEVTHAQIPNPKPSSTPPSSVTEKQQQSDTTITRSGDQSRPPVRFPSKDMK